MKTFYHKKEKLEIDLCLHAKYPLSIRCFSMNGESDGRDSPVRAEFTEMFINSTDMHHTQGLPKPR